MLLVSDSCQRQGANADNHYADIPADLNDQSLNLLRLYRTGACRHGYTAKEDDFDDVSIYMHILFTVTIALHIIVISQRIRSCYTDVYSPLAGL